MEELYREILVWLGSLVCKGQALSFRKGQVLFYEGHIPYGIYLVRSGIIAISSKQEECPPEVAGKIPQGEIYGLDAILQKHPFCCTGTAQTDCEAIFISRNLLEPMLKQWRCLDT